MQRFAEAQICGAHGADEAAAREKLAVWRFVYPESLWWGFDWDGARRHLARQRGLDPAEGSVPGDGGDPRNGVVVLLDEIDKADSDVPNGLLEALGAGCFDTPDCGRVVQVAGREPLVIITTNLERVLPDAFMRRCLILRLEFPVTGELVRRAEAHFGPAHRAVYQDAARQLQEDRGAGPTPLPGLAEYLDLIRAVLTLATTQKRPVDEVMDEVMQYPLRKYQGDVKP